MDTGAAQTPEHRLDELIAGADIPPAAFVWQVRVEKDDIDEQGHASNVSVVKWMSQAAGAHSRFLGYDQAAYQRLGGLFVVRRHEVDYLSRAALGESLLCFTWPSALARATAERRHRIVRPADGSIVAEGLNVWAFLDAATHRPLRIPPVLREAFDPARFLR